MDEAGKLLRAGTIPRPFVQRMRLINAISATMIYKLDSDLLAPYDVIDLHHLLDVPISQGAIIEQLDSGGIRHALTTGDLTPLGDMAEENPALLEGLLTFWLHRFFMVPFDPLCIMLAMRAKLILELVDELGHSYNLLRSLKWGWIDFGDIPDEYPGDPGDYYDPAFDNPILPPDGYTPPGTGEPGAWPAATDAEKAAYAAAPISDRRTLGNLAGTYGVSMSGQLVGGGDFGSHAFPPIGGDPCADKDNPAETVSIGYTTQGMQVDEEQELSVVGYHPKWAPSNYKWTIESGGGSLSEETGYKTTYTAPSENPNCDLSPTIALWCGDEIVDTLQIAVNAWMSTGNAAQEFSLDGIECSPYTASSCKCTRLCYVYNCDNSIASEPTCGAGEGGELLLCTESYPPRICSESCDAVYGVSDMRTSEMIQLGCCPAILL
jgi:hypothetical protein